MIFSQTKEVIRISLALEAKGGQSLFAMVLFNLTLAVLLHYGLEIEGAKNIRALFGFYWLAIFFTSQIGIQLAFRHEKLGVLRHLRTMSVSPIALFVAKVIVQILFLWIMCIVQAFVFALLFDLQLDKQASALLIPPLITTVGISALGIFSVQLVQNSRYSEVLLPLFFFPMALPMFLFGLKWSLGLLVAPDQIFGNAAYLSILISLVWLWIGTLFQDFLWFD